MTVLSTSKPHKLDEEVSSNAVMQKGVCILTGTQACIIWNRVQQTDTAGMLHSAAANFRTFL